MVALSALLKKNRDILGKIKLSATELSSADVGGSGTCALYFTQGRSVLISGLNIAALDVQQPALLHYLHQGTALTEHGLEARALAYRHVLFVCAHVKVDKRCAYCGPSNDDTCHMPHCTGY